MKCDGQHVGNKCPANFYIRPFVCHNCRGNHTANISRCPAWLRYKQELQFKNSKITEAWNDRKVAYSSSKARVETTKSQQTTASSKHNNTPTYASLVATTAINATTAPPTQTKQQELTIPACQLDNFHSPDKYTSRLPS